MIQLWRKARPTTWKHDGKEEMSKHGAKTNDVTVVEGPAGGSAIDELTKMVRDLQIAQARRNDGDPQV